MPPTARKTVTGTATAAKPQRPAHATVIVAHTTRQAWADRLALDIAADYVSLDVGRLGCTKNHLRAWRYLAEHTKLKWSLVVEDDAVPIPDFLPQTAMALDAAPAPIVSLYLGRQRPPQHQPRIAAAVQNAADNGHAWITGQTLFHAVALAIKTELVPSLVAYISHNPYCHLDIDEAITEWAHYQGHLIAYTQPSLVDHRDEGTIAKHRDGAERESGRIAYVTGGRDDWHTDITAL